MDKNMNRKITGKLFSSKVNLQIKKIHVKGTIWYSITIWSKDGDMRKRYSYIINGIINCCIHSKTKPS